MEKTGGIAANKSRRKLVRPFYKIASGRNELSCAFIMRQSRKNANKRRKRRASSQAAQLEAAICQTETQLEVWLNARPARLQALATRMGATPTGQGDGLSAVLGR